MRRYFIATMLLAPVLLTGCFSDTTSKTSISQVGTQAAVTGAAAEESGEEKLDEAVRASLESMEARLEELDEISEALESAEAAMTSMEESFQAAISSLTGETFNEPAGGEGMHVAYDRLMESPSDYLRAELTFSGSVVQLAELADGEMQLLLAVDNHDDTRLVGVFSRSVFSDSLGRGDLVRITGRFGGVNHYRMSSGVTVKLPYLEIGELVVEGKVQTIPEPATEPTDGASTEAETTTDAWTGQADSAETTTDAATGQADSAETTTTAAAAETETTAPTGPAGPGTAGPGQSAGPGTAGPGVVGPGQSAGPGVMSTGPAGS